MVDDYKTIEEIIKLMRSSKDLGDYSDMFLGICESKLQNELDTLKLIYEDMRKEL